MNESQPNEFRRKYVYDLFIYNHDKSCLRNFDELV